MQNQLATAANEPNLRQDNSIEIVRGAGDGTKTKIEDSNSRTRARKPTKVPQNIHRISHQSRNRPSGDDALTEVLQQLDEEDEEASHGDTDDCDYEEKSSAGDVDTEDQSEDTEDSPEKNESPADYMWRVYQLKETTEEPPKQNRKETERDIHVWLRRKDKPIVDPTLILKVLWRAFPCTGLRGKSFTKHSLTFKKLRFNSFLLVQVLMCQRETHRSW
ncbi:unnamed protein product [Phytophthora fragariaefolia]|uniref:Unnamed protein product n=1 Tax=Phytophthora fragariaefolia TaxID=1490495 RepID=A0A9W6UCT5_9STRA|nr:unnamed protein product [Phytophthora fragariaefolia]